MELKNKRILLIGTGGTGKSTYIHQLIKTEPRPKTIIYDIDANPHYAEYPIIRKEDAPRWKKGIARVIDVDYEEAYTYLAKCKDTFLVLEDCTKYISDKKPPKWVCSLALSAKQKGNDTLFTFHSFVQCDGFFMRNCDWMVIFKTGEKIEHFSAKVPMFEKVATAFNRVKSHESKYYNESVLMSL